MHTCTHFHDIIQLISSLCPASALLDINVDKDVLSDFVSPDISITHVSSKDDQIIWRKIEDHNDHIDSLIELLKKKREEKSKAKKDELKRSRKSIPFGQRVVQEDNNVEARRAKMAKSFLFMNNMRVF